MTPKETPIGRNKQLTSLKEPLVGGIFFSHLSSLLSHYLLSFSFFFFFLLPDEVPGDHVWSTECLNKPLQPDPSY